MPDEVRRIQWNGWRYEMTTLGIGIAMALGIGMVFAAFGHPPRFLGLFVGVISGMWLADRR